MLKKALALGVVVLSVVVFSAAQDTGHFDASFSWGGAFGKTSGNTFNGVSVVSTNSALLLGTFRVRFNRMHGLEFNYAHTNDSHIYILGADDFRVQGSVAELSGAYTFNPFTFHKFDPFLFAGAGELRFNPGNTYIDGFQSSFGAAQQSSLAFLYGGGFDYSVWRSLALRLQYRGLIYKEPTFHLQQFFTGSETQMREATVGVVLKF